MSPRQLQAQMRLLRRFVEVFCADRHGGPAVPCRACAELVEYARGRLEKCPFDPKPKCRHCRVHCYDAEHRRRIREVMRHSGMHFVKRGRLDWLVRYFLVRK